MTKKRNKYNLVLGLEIHLQLNTKYKMFCGCNAMTWGDDPNTSTCPTCLGLPGALPVPNKEAIEKTHKLGLAFGCKVNEDSRFDRKHYFYPDLPKGYQISQYKRPFCENGKMTLDSGKVVEITRIHLEEDTAKSFHQGSRTLIDFNKSGKPLVEIVTEPCFESVEDAVEFSKQIRNTARLLGVSDADMEKGQMRVEPNISLRTEEQINNGELPNYKVEIKNINSFKFMEKAVRAEIKRQTEALDKGEKLTQENRGYDENKNITLPQREKEEAHDYRYFPEPDIPPFKFEKEYFNKLKNNIPELPWETKQRYKDEYDLNVNNVKILIDNMGPDYIAKFEELILLGLEPKKALNITLNKKGILDISVEDLINEIKKEGSKLKDKDELEGIVKKVIADNKKAVEDYRAGKGNSVEFLLGMVMRETKGKADPNIVRELIKSNLDK